MPGVCQPASGACPTECQRQFGKWLDLHSDSYYLPVSVVEEIAFAQGLADV